MNGFEYLTLRLTDGVNKNNHCFLWLWSWSKNNLHIVKYFNYNIYYYIIIDRLRAWMDCDCMDKYIL